MKVSLTSREAHDVKDAVQLVMMVRVTGLDILLATVEYGLRRQQLCKDAANRPDVWQKKKSSLSHHQSQYNWLHMFTLGNGGPTDGVAHLSPMALV